MKHRLIYGVAGLAAVVLAAPTVKAQEIHGHDICRDVGHAAPEQLGDREGHAIAFTEGSCKIMEGPTAGAVMTNSGVWEWNGPSATLLTGYGAERTPGATMAFQTVDGKLDLTMTDGKPTGWTAVGHSVVVLASGQWAALKGKTISWNAKSTGPFEYEIDGTFK